MYTKVRNKIEFMKSVDNRVNYEPIRISGIYLLIAVSWIITSDMLARYLADDKDILERLSIVKGIIYVILTSVVLFVLVRRLIIRIELEQEKSKRLIEELNIKNFALQSSMSGKFFLDTEMRITYINDSFLKIMRVEAPKNVINRDILSFFPYDEQISLEVALNNESFWEGEIRSRRSDGEVFWAYLTINPIKDKGGKVYGLMGSFMDITDGVKVKEELVKAKEEAEKANNIKSLFLANMSHEIRTPMNGIIGMIELISGTEITEKQSKWLNIAKTSANHLLQIINDILDISKIEANKFVMINEKFDLVKCYKRKAEIFEKAIEKKDIELIWDIRLGESQIVIGDEIRVYQILNNLVSNAIKFTQKGKVIITCEKVSESDDKLFIRTSVSDTGIGIPSDKIDLLFKNFSQINNGSVDNHNGTGLGLAITKRIVELMGGEISVTSTENVGSTFSFLIPFNKVEEKDKILVGEIDTPNKLVIKNLLNIRGYDFIILDSGKDILEEFKTGKYVLILTNVLLKDIDGLETTTLIRDIEAKSGGHIPIIAITAVVLDGGKEKCLKAGMDGYITKPIIPEELFDIISRFLQ